jgi:hypothetical protein
MFCDASATTSKTALVKRLKRSESFIIPNNPLARHSGVGRNPVIKALREADKTMMLPHLRGKLLIVWISASAGMTQFF